MFIIVFIIVGIFLYYKHLVCEQIFTICQDYIDSYCTESINYALYSPDIKNINYYDLINIEKDINGEIVMINTNANKINLINQTLINTTNNILKNKVKNGIPIPLLAFSGIDVISGLGTVVNFKTLNIISCICEFDSNFQSVGINQTLHSIFAIITVKINIEIPFNNRDIICKNKILLNETVLIGKVPEVYLK